MTDTQANLTETLAEAVATVAVDPAAAYAGVADLPTAKVLDAAIATDLTNAHNAHQGFLDRVDAAVNATLAGFHEEGAKLEGDLKALWAKALTSVGLESTNVSQALSAPPVGDAHIVDAVELQNHLQAQAFAQVNEQLATLGQAVAQADVPAPAEVPAVDVVDAPAAPEAPVAPEADDENTTPAQ